jgi:hypothetical protein
MQQNKINECWEAIKFNIDRVTDVKFRGGRQYMGPRASAYNRTLKGPLHGDHWSR